MLLVALFVLARAAAPAPAPAPTPALDEEPPAPTIVERIDEPRVPAVAPVPLPVQPPTPAPKPAPAAPAPAASPPTPVTAPPPTPQPKARPAPPAPAPASTGGAWGVHVASYRKKEVADTEAKRIGNALALPARVVRVDLGSKGVWHRVVVGDAPSASDAARLRDAVKAKGYPDALVVRAR